MRRGLRTSNSAAERATARRGLGATVAVENVRVLLSALEGFGYDPSALLAAAGVSRSDVDQPDARFRASTYVALLREARRQRRIPNLALKMAAATPIGAYPVIDYLVVTCETVEEALRQQARYFGLAGAPVSVDLQVSNDGARVIVDSPLHPFGAEYIVALTILHTMRETDGRFHVQYVSFAHQPDDQEEFARTVRCPVRSRRPWSGFAVSQAMLALPLRRQDPPLRQLLERHAAEIAARLPPSDDLVLAVRSIVARSVARGEDIRIQAVARQVAMAARTLQRKLLASGVTYHDLLDDVRRETAIDYLTRLDWSIGEISGLLGYADRGVFDRAFRRWTGLTPQAYREREQAKSQ